MQVTRHEYETMGPAQQDNFIKQGGRIIDESLPLMRRGAASEEVRIKEASKRTMLECRIEGYHDLVEYAIDHPSQLAKQESEKAKAASIETVDIVNQLKHEVQELRTIIQMLVNMLDDTQLHEFKKRTGGKYRKPRKNVRADLVHIVETEVEAASIGAVSIADAYTSLVDTLGEQVISFETFRHKVLRKRKSLKR